MTSSNANYIFVCYLCGESCANESCLFIDKTMFLAKTTVSCIDCIFARYGNFDLSHNHDGDYVQFKYGCHQCHYNTTHVFRFTKRIPPTKAVFKKEFTFCNNCNKALI